LIKKNKNEINPSLVIGAVLNAKEIIEGMGSLSKSGSTHLFEMNLPINTISAIFHGIIVKRLKKNSDYRLLDGKRDNLIDEHGNVIIVKVTSDRLIKANHIKNNFGYYIVVKYGIKSRSIYLDEILAGDLIGSDWIKQEKSNFAILSPDGQKKLVKIFGGYR
jgi:hypothetical protein